MVLEFKVSELSEKINLSRQAIYDKIATKIFNVIVRKEQGKKVQFISLTEKEFEDLKTEYGLRLSVKTDSGLIQPENNFNQPAHANQQNPQMQTEQTINPDRLFDFFDKYRQDLINLNQENKQLYSQVTLIEDKQRTAQQDSEFYKNELFKSQNTIKELEENKKLLVQEIEALKKQITVLQAENQDLKTAVQNNKKWWQFK